MIWKLSLLVLLCSIIILVKSESYIEVDENGDEFEVKKFYIQGRQLNDAPQCVVTRRKRGTDTSRQYNLEPDYEPTEADNESSSHVDENRAEDLEDNEDVDESQDVIRVEDTGAMNNDMKIQSHTDSPIDNSEDIKPTDSKPTDSKPMEKPSKNENEQSTILPHNNNENKEKEEMVTMPIIQKEQKKNKLQKVTLIRPQHTEETIDHAAELPQQSFQIIPSSLLSNTAANEFIVINGQNPQNNLGSSISSLLGEFPNVQNYEDGSDILPISWTYSNQPISTSAIWSTGENIDNDSFNKINKAQNADKFPEDFSSSDIIDPDYSTYPLTQELMPSLPVVNRPPKKNSRPQKSRPNKRRKVVVRRPSNPVRRPVRPKPNKRQKPVANRTTRRPTNLSSPNRNKNKTNNKRKSNKPAQNILNNNNKKNKRKKNKTRPQSGVLVTTYTRSVTSTGNDSKIDCIIINKDKEVPKSTTTTSTTARPFWNVFGRRAQGRDFGNRKRVNLRFSA